MLARKIHKWMGIVVGVQVLIWVVSGMIISILNHQVASGNSTKQAIQNMDTSEVSADLYPLEKLAIDKNLQLMSISLERVGTLLIYYVETQSFSLAFDAITGQTFVLNQAEAVQIAQQSYKGDGAPVESIFLEMGSEEVPNNQMVWRVNFDDDLQTRVYISGLNGKVMAHRNKYWAIVDFLLMLHFMDYAKVQGFNNPQIIFFGFLTLWLTISGSILVVRTFSKRDFTIKGFTR